MVVGILNSFYVVFAPLLAPIPNFIQIEQKTQWGGGARSFVWMDGRTNGNSPSVLYDIVPFRVCCPKRAGTKEERRSRVGAGTGQEQRKFHPNKV